MKYTDKLFNTNPFDFSKGNKTLFVKSFSECALAHYKGNKIFRAFWDDSRINPKDIKTENDIKSIPPIMVHLFKENEFISVPTKDIVLKLTSSGTGGQKSQMLLNYGSLSRVKESAYQIHKYLGITSDDKVNYLCFTYDPRIAKDLGTAFTDELLTSFTGINEVYYAIQWNKAKKDFQLNEKGVLATLERFSRDKKHPTRILGFPAFLYKLIKENDIYLKLAKNSFVQTGGGWKGFANEEIPKGEFRTFISNRLGIPIENIRDMFGMVEHGIPYVDCKLGNLHVPNYSRVFIRSPKDLSILPEGEIGLIHFICSYNDSYPSISLLTTDWGKLGKCNCGIGGNTLKILGRAGITKHKGCAILAAELLK